MCKPNKLLEILNHSVNVSQYYRELNIDQSHFNISSFPILTKDVLCSKREQIIADDYRNTLLKDCSIHLSSGTVGKPIEVFWHYDDEMVSNLSLWRLRAKFHGIKPNSKCCTLHSTNYSWNRITDYQKIVLSKDRKTLSLCKLFFDNENMLEYYNEIIKFQPEWLLFQPSNFVKLTEYMMRNHLEKPASIRYIEFTGECLTSKAIELVKKYYNCSHANMYGTTETNGIAYTCPFGNMHILTDNVFVEIPRYNFGKAIVTSLTNKVFPLIRYEIGDMIKIKKCDKCKCGLSGYVIDEITGRCQNIVELENGNTISEMSIMSIIDRLNSVIGNIIKEYKAQIYTGKKYIDIMVYIDPCYKAWEKKIKKEFDSIISHYFDYFYKSHINFVYTPISIKSNGKFSILEVVQ